mmetsp:Transcript_81971/g.171553  ORF Transcript_81971/g.171553 Transcript_81971/m.171553 type:complete len:967 (+) Transcript_81971:128-3028(+)
MAANQGQMAQLVQLLSQTTTGNTQSMQAATEQLRRAETQPGFGLVLLELLRDASVNPGARQAGAIYFKNYVKRQWCIEGAGGVPPSDRQAIKQHLLGLMLQTPKPVQVMLAAGLEEISLTDYPEEWPTLLPEIVQHLKTSQDMMVLKGTMETINTVLLKYRSQARSNQVLKELKYTVTTFQETHLMVFKAAAQRILSGSVQGQELLVHFELMAATLGCFYSLCVIDLPEYFEDHRQQYFEGFLGLLKFHNEVIAGKGEQGLEEQVKGLICECFTLFTDKYQEEFQPFLLPCVKDTWELLVGVDQQDKFDQLVAKGIRFLSSAAMTHWPQSPFEDPNVLSGICEKVVFPNIVLRDSDLELFEDNPLEYVRRDMENADQDTRRRSAMDLVKAMGRLNEAKVTDILVGYVKALIGQAGQSNPEQAERYKDACIYLCIAMAVKGQTVREGVTVVNPNVNIMDFFTSLVTPELTSGKAVTNRSILRASCLKFVTVFRNQLSKEQIGSILPTICKHISVEAPVVHTYAAICLDKLMTVRDKDANNHLVPRYDPQTLRPHLLPVVDPILRIIASSQGIPMNEYLMRTVARIFAFLKQLGGEAGLATLKPLAQIVVAMAANPSNPSFNHNLFEAVACIVKVVVPHQPEAVEGILLPAMAQILEQNVVDFLPYTFQILGLLLDASPTVKPMYQDLFGRLMAEHLWKTQSNVPGLVRLVRAYFGKHAAFQELLRAHMEPLLMRFQFVLSNRKTEGSAFDFLNAMYMYLPVEFYQQHFKTLMTILLTRLQSSKSPKTQRDFVVSSCLLLHRDSTNLLPRVLQEIQVGLLGNLVAGIWPGVLKMSLRLDERKICFMGTAKLMALDDVKQNVQVFSGLCVSLISLLSLLPCAGTKVTDDASDDELEDTSGAAGQDFEVSFAKLKNTDLPGAQHGLAPDVPDLHQAAMTVLKQNFAPLVDRLAQGNPEIQPLAAFISRAR